MHAFIYRFISINPAFIKKKNNTTNTNNIAVDSSNKSISFNQGATSKSTISNSGNYLRLEGDGILLRPTSGSVDITPQSGNINLVTLNGSLNSTSDTTDLNSKGAMFLRTIHTGNVNLTSNNDMFIRSENNVNVEATTQHITISSLVGEVNIGGFSGTNIVSNTGNVNLNSTTGQVLCEQTPTVPTSVVNKQYVDNKVPELYIYQAPTDTSRPAATNPIYSDENIVIGFSGGSGYDVEARIQNNGRTWTSVWSTFNNIANVYLGQINYTYDLYSTGVVSNQYVDFRILCADDLTAPMYSINVTRTGLVNTSFRIQKDFPNLT